MVSKWRLERSSKGEGRKARDVEMVTYDMGRTKTS